MEKGNLALFCAACPQPGINLPDNWGQDTKEYVDGIVHCHCWIEANIDSRWLYRRTIVADGNFSLEKTKSKNPANDVALTNGEGYMVRESEYREHLVESLDDKQVNFAAPCAQHGEN